MITKYEEFVNEGFYDWMHKDMHESWEVIITVFAMFVNILWIPYTTEENEQIQNILLLFIIMIDLPILTYFAKKGLRNFYHKLRAKFLLNKTPKVYNKIKNFLDKYPDIKEQIAELKMRMNDAVKDNNKKEISVIIHQLYKIKKNIDNREKIGDFLELDNEEKDIYKKKKQELDKIDPFREEEWNEN